MNWTAGVDVGGTFTDLVAVEAPHGRSAACQGADDAGEPGGGWRATPVYWRESLPGRLEGPAIIEQLDCTTVLEPGNRAEVDALGNLIVTIGE